MNKSERQRGRMTEIKLKLAGGDHRLAQVFIRPEVFSIHMKGLKIRALGCSQLSTNLYYTVNDAITSSL
jgi:hypothetical protein